MRTTCFVVLSVLCKQFASIFCQSSSKNVGGLQAMTPQIQRFQWQGKSAKIVKSLSFRANGGFSTCVLDGQILSYVFKMK